MSGELKSQLAEKYTEYEAASAALQSDHSDAWKTRDEETERAWQLREQEHAAALQEHLEEYERALSARDIENTQAWQARDEEHSKAWQLREQEHAKAIEERLKNHEQTLKAHEQEHEHAWAERDQKYTKDWELREQEHAKTLEIREEEHEMAKRALQQEHASALDGLEKSFTETFENLQAEHKNTKAEWERKFASQDSDYQLEVSNMNLEMNFMRDEFGKILRAEETRTDKNAADLDAVRAEMSAVLNSTSWKMTSGLRRVMNLLKGVKAKDTASRLSAPNTPPRLEYKPDD